MCIGIAPILGQRLTETLYGLKNKPLEEWTVLSGFTFSCSELASRVKHPVDDVRAFIKAFTLPHDERNSNFASLQDFNAAYAYPFIQKDEDEFVLLQYYGVTEAFYETPFYWMVTDKSYSSTALRHRGDFTETLAAERLLHVFGPSRVFRNVNIFKNKGQNLGEIDVLVIFGDQFILVQSKSKKLTLEARKGNDRVLRNDFQKAIQDAVDQSFTCADLLQDPSITMCGRDDEVIRLPEPPRTIFPLAIIPDHYPALAFQTFHFLEAKTTDRVVFPLVTDVFALDAMTEMLSTPLWFLSYLSLRARYHDRLMASHEHMILSYHLKNNLWIKGDLDLMMIEDNFSVHLDAAMAVRRDGVPGSATPEGILTRLVGTPLGRVLTDIEDEPKTAAIDFGLTLLELRESTLEAINKSIERVLVWHSRDGKLHDISIALPDASTGLTIHCSRLIADQVENTLRQHCRIAKYRQRVDRWFGLALHPDGSVQLVGEIVEEWKFNREMEGVVRELADAEVVKMTQRVDVGRNDPCPCGSGKKYKRCCISS